MNKLVLFGAAAAAYFYTKKETDPAGEDTAAPSASEATPNLDTPNLKTPINALNPGALLPKPSMSNAQVMPTASATATSKIPHGWTAAHELAFKKHTATIRLAKPLTEAETYAMKEKFMQNNPLPDAVRAILPPAMLRPGTTKKIM